MNVHMYVSIELKTKIAQEEIYDGIYKFLTPYQST